MTPPLPPLRFRLGARVRLTCDGRTVAAVVVAAAASGAYLILHWEGDVLLPAGDQGDAGALEGWARYLPVQWTAGGWKAITGAAVVLQPEIHPDVGPLEMGRSRSERGT